MKASAQLRQLLKRGRVVAPSCFDPFSARLAQLAGFEAIHLTGLGVEATQLAAPDVGLLTLTELSSHAARMAAAVTVPILADIDTGFGGILNVHRTIQEMERAGVAGVHIEDQVLPKRCPLLGSRAVVSRADALGRLKAALDARSDPDLLIVARTDADVISLNEVIERSNLYLEAGADMVMPITMLVDGRSYFDLDPVEQMEVGRKLVHSINGPVMTMGFSPPAGYTVDDLFRCGYALTIFAGSALRAAANAMADVFRNIRSTGTDAGFFATNPGPHPDMIALMQVARLEEHQKLEQLYVDGAGGRQ